MDSKLLVGIGDTFTTSHKPKEHSITIGKRTFGTFASEVALVQAAIVNLRDCVVLSTSPNWDWTTSENDRKFCFSHTWKRVK